MTSIELKAFMAKHNLDERTFAGILGVTLGSVNHWRTGRRQMSLTVSRLVRTFDKYPGLLKEFGVASPGR